MLPETQNRLLQFKALADPVRIRLLRICASAECSVSELTKVTQQSQPRISQHLKQLCSVGLLERFRDGHFVFYRVPTSGPDAVLLSGVHAVLPKNDPIFENDLNRLRTIRADDAAVNVPTSPSDRSLHRALVELTVSQSIGDLLDIGCGQGRILKLLASRAQRAVGVDINSDARRFARAEMLLAGMANTSLRQADMVALPFADDEFDTIILDDVLRNTERAQDALKEALRVLRPQGRIIFLATVGEDSVSALSAKFGALAESVSLRLTTPRAIPSRRPTWLLATAIESKPNSVAA